MHFVHHLTIKWRLTTVSAQYQEAIKSENILTSRIRYRVSPLNLKSHLVVMYPFSLQVKNILLFCFPELHHITEEK